MGMNAVAILASLRHGARRIGWGPYLRYRLHSIQRITRLLRERIFTTEQK